MKIFTLLTIIFVHCLFLHAPAFAEDEAQAKTLFAQPRLMSMAINVADLKKSLHFYTQLLGMTEYQRYPGKDQLEVTLSYGPSASQRPQTEAPGAMLVITEKATKQGAYDLGDGFSRLAFGVPNAKAAFDKIVAAGFAAVRAPMAIAGGKITIAFVKDPDGYLVELIEASADY